MVESSSIKAAQKDRAISDTPCRIHEGVFAFVLREMGKFSDLHSQKSILTAYRKTDYS